MAVTTGIDLMIGKTIERIEALEWKRQSDGRTERVVVPWDDDAEPDIAIVTFTDGSQVAVHAVWDYGGALLSMEQWR